MLTTGKRLAGRYELTDVLGSGGMAVVYKATDHVLDRPVAIKVMKESVKDSQEFVHRFIREAKAAGRLAHPNVVSIYDIAREKSIYYMVMEYVEGITLAEYVHRSGALRSAEAIEIVMQICDGLTHAHENDIVHRDIKTQNIMRTAKGLYKITDFGISSFSNVSSSLTQSGTIMGSAYYLSPEQASGKKVTKTSDLYAVGVLLFFLVTGHYPFDGETPVSIGVKHIQEELPDPQSINPLIPAALCEVIRKAMAKDPADRFQSAEELKQALMPILAELPPVDRPQSFDTDINLSASETAVTLTTQTLPFAQTDGKQGYKKIWVSAILGAVALLGSGWMYWAYANKTTPPPKTKQIVQKTVTQPKSEPSSAERTANIQKKLETKPKKPVQSKSTQQQPTTPKPKQPAPKQPNPQQSSPKITQTFPGKQYFREGQRNKYVTQLGQLLVNAGFDEHYSVGPSPEFTSADKRNVQAFQKSQGWTGSDADGYPGPETWKKLVEKWNRDHK